MGRPKQLASLKFISLMLVSKVNWLQRISTRLSVESSTKKVTANVSFNSKKLSSFFSVKKKIELRDKTEIKHKHNLVYKVTCPDCPATYIGEARRRLQERVDDYGGRDKNSHVLIT
eukprot:TCONS_00040658-protein